MWKFSSACVLMAVNNKPLERNMQIFMEVYPKPIHVFSKKKLF